jgi:transglutaminase-like putative cysteine protease
MPILSIRHVTRYRYRNPVALGEHRMMFRPHESYDQQLLSADLAICPTPSKINYLRDVFGNSVGVASFTGRTTDLVFDSYVRLLHTPHPGVPDLHDRLALGPGAERFAYDEPELTDLAPSIMPAHADPDGTVSDWARRFVRYTGPTNAAGLLVEMTQAIRADFTYRKRLEMGAQTPLQTLKLNSGSCRDYAVLMIEAARGLGLAARFVSGYVYSPAPTRNSRARVGGGHTHAWVSVYLPESGWVEFDPTNGIVGNADLIRVAVARDPRQATPLHGTYTGLSTDYLGMEVTVDVQAEDQAMVQPARLRAVG